MRRPEVKGFVCVSPPANKFDFSFLAPCPVSGLLIQGTHDEIVTPASVQKVAERLSKQKNIDVELTMVSEADHFFLSHLEHVSTGVQDYLMRRRKSGSF